jgi:hypothetical protein
MYKIIGADRVEYGPVTADRIQQWIAEGRANARTLARSEGTGEWRPLAEFAEFNEMLKAQAAVAPPPPRIASAEVDRMAATIIARDYQLDIGDCFSRAWRLLQENFWLLVGATAVVMLIALGLGALPVIGMIAIVLLGFVLMGGLDWLFLKRVRGQTADMADAFAGFSLAFVPLMVAGLVIQVLTAAGLILCILPGIYLLVIWWGFVPLLILDKKMDFWPAMELSRKVVNHHWWQIFGLTLAALLVATAGLLLLGVGIFLTLPLATGAIVIAYEQIFGESAGLAARLPGKPIEPSPGELKTPAPVVPAPTTPPPATPPAAAAPPTAHPNPPAHGSLPPTLGPGPAVIPGSGMVPGPEDRPAGTGA